MTPQQLQLQIQQLSNALGGMNGRVQQLAQENERLRQTVTETKILTEALKNTSFSPGPSPIGGDFRARKTFAKAWGGAGYVSLDNIEGRFVPYDLFVEIPIAGDSSQSVNGTLSVDIAGPFVAVKRYAAFLSQYKYQVQFSNGTKATFNGRSFGRWRGISSNTDVNDAMRAFDQLSQYQPMISGAIYNGTDIIPVLNPAAVNPGSVDPTNTLPNFPGTGRPLVVSPTSMSSGRSMGFDGTVAIVPQGAQFNRQNIPVPTSLWVDQFNGAVELGCYDVFEPGEQIVATVTPTHPNNPAFGNIQSLVALNADYAFDPATGAANNNPLPVGNWPWIQGQFDGHEGINDETLLGDTSVDVDRVIRVPAGILVIGYMGFRIIQAPGRQLSVVQCSAWRSVKATIHKS